MEASPIPHKERRSTSFPGSQYLLPSDEVEKTRLQKLHSLLTRVNGNRLVLSPVELQPGDKVLDIGAGPGRWILDLAFTVPKSIQFLGIDIESGFFPPTPAENVTMKVVSVLDMPTEWTNEFQLVHQRLLFGALTNDEWPTAIRGLFRVTKPNGWVELSELDANIICPQHETHKALRIMPDLLRSTDHEGNVGVLLPQWLRDVGFTDVQTVEAHVPFGKWAGKIGEDGCEGAIAALQALKPATLKAGGLGIAKSEEEYDELLGDIEQIWNETPGSGLKLHTVYARKPLQVI